MVDSGNLAAAGHGTSRMQLPPIPHAGPGSGGVGPEALGERASGGGHSGSDRGSAAAARVCRSPRGMQALAHAAAAAGPDPIGTAGTALHSGSGASARAIVGSGGAGVGQGAGHPVSLTAWLGAQRAVRAACESMGSGSSCGSLPGSGGSTAMCEGAVSAVGMRPRAHA